MTRGLLFVAAVDRTPRCPREQCPLCFPRRCLAPRKQPGSGIRSEARARAHWPAQVRFAPVQGNNLLLVGSWDAHVRLYDVAQGRLTGLHKLDAAVLDRRSALLPGGGHRLVPLIFRLSDPGLGPHGGSARGCVNWGRPRGASLRIQCRRERLALASAKDLGQFAVTPWGNPGF